MNAIKISNIYFITVISMFVLCFSACKKKDDSATPATPTGTLLFHLHTNVDTNEVDSYNTVYKNTDGRRISVSKAQLYISNIQLIKLDGSTYNVPNTILYKVQESEVYTVGNVPVGNYKSVSFFVGLDATTSQKTPATVDSSLNQPSMWYGSTAQPQGYTFVNFQGSIDTSVAPSSTAALVPFKYLLGTSTAYKQVTMPVQNYSVIENQNQFVHMIIDYNKLFTGVQLNNLSNLTLTVSADNANALGVKMANNIPSMFSYEY